MALRIPLSWMKDFVDVDLSASELAERLTVAGMEVEKIHTIGGDWAPDLIKVGKVLSVSAHPDADRLCLVSVDHGASAPLTVVTGAPNLVSLIGKPLPTLKVALALVGAEVIDGHATDGRKIKLKPAKLRGVPSEGMVCSEYELGLSQEHEGILFLPDDAPVGAPLAQVLGDTVLEFDIKGGFAHLQSVFGIARETGAITRKALNKNKIMLSAPPAGQADPGFVKLEITDPALCRRYMAMRLEGVKVGPSPFWMQQRLTRAGMRPINVVVDITNYVMLELGQPLHAFDLDKLKGSKKGEPPLIRVRRATPGETITTLDGVERKLEDHMLLITDGGGPVAVAGVMGGQESEVDASTTRVLLESANFEFLNNRRTSQALKLRTEASDRFGRNLEPELCQTAIHRAAGLLVEWAGATLHPVVGDVYPAPQTRPAISLSGAFIRRVLGVEVPQKEAQALLTSLEFSCQPTDPDTLAVTPPPHRQDVNRPADLVEEIARLTGYDRLPPTLIRDALPPQRRSKMLDGTEGVRDILTGCGLDEIITYSIVSLEDERRLYPEDQGFDPQVYLSVRNPLSAERAHLRRRLLTEGLNTLRTNLRFTKRLALFEVGAVFLKVQGETLPKEHKRLSVLLTGPRNPAHWHGGGTQEPFEFFDAKGVAEALLNALEIPQPQWERGDDPAYHPGRSARVMVNGQVLGQLGELHPRVVESFGLPMQPVAALEFDLEALVESWREDKKMDGLSIHPPVLEDLAFVVDEALPAHQVAKLIAQTGGSLLKEVVLFDHYKHEKLGVGKKSLAYALTYQAPDRTLTDQEVAKVRGKIIQRLEKDLGAVLRG
ncbi:MAG: phenylalanine--tRNA ligase subunit beta [Deltaproteobacteria bacterium]|nr:phenylalanine--tRNA ligase subunit beta [Deltaproteobacteria bacterium]